MRFIRLFLLTFILIIISGFGVSAWIADEPKNVEMAFQIPSESHIYTTDELLISEDPAIRETTQEIIKERHLEPEVVSEPPAPPAGRWVWALVTAYEPSHVSCGPYADGKTSTNVNVLSADPHKAYGYAVDPSIIPYGTRIYVPGYWEALQRNRNPDFRPTEPLIADDTGSAMRRSGRKGIIHIDVRFRTIEACKKWGVKRMKVFIYDE